MTWQFGTLQMFGFDLIAADPPWDFENWSDAGTDKGADPHYDVMSLDAICNLRVGELASGDCLLLMWNCSWMRPSDRERVMRAWGFTYKTELAWVKRTPAGKIRMGTGYRARSMHETIYLGTIGSPQHKAFPSVFDGVAREHSRKPEEFYNLVDRQMPAARKLDLFSRQNRPGWSAWGNEAGKFDRVAT